MALNVNSLVSVTIQIAPKAIANRGFGIMLIIGSSDIITTEQRLKFYDSLNDVATDFATTTNEYKAATVFFAQSPSPSRCAIGRWNKTPTGSNLVLKGGTLGELTTIQQSGGFVIPYNTVDMNVDVDLTTSTSFEMAAQSISDKLYTPATPATEFENTLKGSDRINGAIETFKSNYNSMCKLTSSNMQFIIKDEPPITMFEVESSINGADFGACAGDMNNKMTLAGKALGKWSVTTSPITLVFTSKDKTKQIIGVQPGTGTQTGFNGFAADTKFLNPIITYTAEQADEPAYKFANCEYVKDHFTITPLTASDTVGLAKAPTTGTDLSAPLCLTSVTGASLVTVATSESAVDAVQKCMIKSQDWYACIFADMLINDDVLKIAPIIEAAVPSRMFGYCSTDINCTSMESTTDIAYLVNANKFKKTTMHYSSFNHFAIASYYGRQLTTDFNANNSVITMMYKQEPTIQAENLDSNQALALKTKCCNVFATYDNGISIIQHGVQADGSWTDEIYGIDWLQNYIQTAVVNKFYTSLTKIPQTEAGMAVLKSAVIQALERAYQNGFLAERYNTTGSSFGQLANGALVPHGYFVYSNPLATQNQADRENRIAPVIQCLGMLSGAFHSASVLVNLVR